MTKKSAHNRRRLLDSIPTNSDGSAGKRDAQFEEIRAKRKSGRKANSLLAKLQLPSFSGAKVWFLVAVGVAIGVLVYLAMAGYKHYMRGIVKTPCPLEPLANESTTAWQMDAERYWGTYRPHLYFGMRTRSKNSMLFGLAYFVQPNEEGPPLIRHLCRDSTGMRSYSWVLHDGRHFGVQEIADELFTMHISFVKRTANTQFGGQWTARIRVTPHNDTINGLSEYQRTRLRETLLSVFVYFYVPEGDSGSQYRLNPHITVSQNAPLTSTLLVDAPPKRQTVANWLEGTTHDIGSFRVGFGHSRASVDYLLTYMADAAHFDELLRTPQLYTVRKLGDNAAQYLALPGVRAASGADQRTQTNLFVYQVTTIVADMLPQAGSEQLLEVAFEPSSSAGARLIGAVFDQEFNMRRDAFKSRFDRTFGLAKRGFSDTDVLMAERVFSNLIGSIGYFHGASVVRSKYTDQSPFYVEYWPASLYTGVPARGQFPRGFLWDEGFHQLLVQEWDAEISVDCIKHWLSLMNIEGWIPREQILGSEARALVPSEFIVQHNENANPPALLLAIERLFGRLGLLGSNRKTSTDDEADAKARYELLAKHFPENVLRNLYMRLRAWIDWYVFTQRGTAFDEDELANLQGIKIDNNAINSFDGERVTFRWRGRDATARRELNPKTLTSGLDDYPRPSHPTDSERHLDLRCWIQFATEFMSRFSAALAARLGTSEPSREGESTKQSKNSSFADHEQYESLARVLRDNQLLKALHWNAQRGFYADYGLHTDAAKLDWVSLARQSGVGQRASEAQREYIRVVKSEPRLQHVTSFGFVSLFPLLFRIIDAHDETLEKTLRTLRDEKLLWTPYGLRSLAKNSPFYQKHNTQDDPPYWRGTVWININYLTVCALQHYAHSDSPHATLAAQLYGELRQNLMRNMLAELRRTGYVFEQYDDVTGQGKGTAPFTGWSALLVLIMAEIC